MFSKLVQKIQVTCSDPLARSQNKAKAERACLAAPSSQLPAPSSQLPAPSSQLAARSPRAVTPSHTPSPAPPPALRHLGWFSVLQPTKCHLPGDTYKLAAAKGTERKGPGKEGEAGQGREERGEDAPGDPQRPSCFVPSADPQETALSSEPTPSPGPHFQARPGQS